MSKRKKGIYERYIKRMLDIVCSLFGIVVLSPLLLILTVVGGVVMKGNPFFVQSRPGKDGKIFKLVKYRTMTNKRDKEGDFLPDAERLTPYGRFLRSTSLDELPELWNILKGDMSVVGPRPLLVEYLPYYTEEEKRRHDVRPGLTGLAQINGRNCITWEAKFSYDLEYVRNITLMNDLQILFCTVKKVMLKSDIEIDTDKSEGNFAKIRKELYKR